MARKLLQISGFLLTFVSFALFSGCQPGPKTDASKSPSNGTDAKPATGSADAKTGMTSAKNDERENPNAARKSDQTTSKQTKTQTSPPPLTIPIVGLTDSLRATCLVNVGNIMPEGEVVSADNSKIAMQSQYGEKFTVVFFWSEGTSNYAKLAADSALSDLHTYVAEPYAEKGIKAIGINVGDKPQAVRQELDKSGVKIPCYFDPEKAYFAKVATAALPRIYLLDASGKILWFDTDYSQATRRNLMQAIRVVMDQK